MGTELRALGGDGDLGQEDGGRHENWLLEASIKYQLSALANLVGTWSALFKALLGAVHIRTQNTHQRHPGSSGWCQEATLLARCLSSTLLIHGTLEWTGLEEGLKTSPTDHREGFLI